jgi:hypothetical protein
MIAESDWFIETLEESGLSYKFGAISSVEEYIVWLQLELRAVFRPGHSS